MVASDGRPEAPEASTQAQVTALRGLAEKLRAAGIRLDTVLYGDAATNKTDQAQKIMADLAEQGGGQLYLAPAGIDLLRVAVSFASAVTGIPEGSGRSVAVRGSVTVPVPVEKDLEALIVVVIRSTPSVKVDVRTPSRELAVGPGGAPASALTVVRPFTNPVAGEYTIEANGEGDIYATTLKRTKPLVDPVASPVPAAPVAVATAAAARPVPQQQPEAKAGGGGFPLWVLLLIPALLAASGGAAAVAWRRAVPERREDLVLWQDGVYIATERVGALRALAATNGELPLSMVFRDSAAALADYRLRRDGDGLTVVSSITEDDVRMLWPDQPVDLPSQPPVRLVLYREGMTPEALERDRPVAQVAMPRRESGRGPQTAAVAMPSSFAAETKQAPDAAVDPLEALAARAAQLRNGRV